MEKINITPSGDKLEVVIREGEAIHPKELAEKSLTISGTLPAVNQFLKGKTIDHAVSHLKIFKDQGKLELVAGDTDPHTTHTITGSLSKDKELLSWRINSQERWTVKSFLEWVRMKKVTFADKGEASALMSSMQKWQGQITTVFKEHNSHDGNSEMVLQKKVDGIDLKREFTLHLPIFQGYPKEKIKVEIGLDPKANSVDLYLISDDLFELEVIRREQYLDAEIKEMESYTFSKIVIS